MKNVEPFTISVGRVLAVLIFDVCIGHPGDPDVYDRLDDGDFL